jgi:peptide/nickel transport system substrate-binding protein
MLRRARGWSALLLVLIFSASPANLAGQPRRELRVGLTRVPAALDPATALEGTAAIVARQVFDSLLAYREGSTDVEPALATRWSVSRDGLVWSFALRDGVVFHDGSPLVASDVVTSFNRHLPPENAPGGRPATAWGALLRGVPGVVKEVRAPNPRTVQFVLVQPYAPLLTVLAHPAFGVAKPSGPDGTGRLVGTGPYRQVDASPGRIALEANTQHWAGAPRWERVLVVDVPGDEQGEADLEAGLLDVWFPVGPPRRAQGARSVPGLRVGYLAFQTEKEPFSRSKLRHAVAAAIDPPSLAVALGAAAVPLQSFLPPGVWARREGSPILGGSRDAVRKLLAEGSWPRGFKPTLVVQAEPGPVDAALVAETLVLNMAAADIPVQLRPPAAGDSRALAAGEHDLALAEARVTGGDPHLLLFPLSTTEGATRGTRVQNFSFYRDPRVDDLLVRASQLAYRAERHRLYQRAQAMLAEELPWIPVYVRLEWGVARPEVRGLRLHPTGFHRWHTLALEPPA